MNYKIITTDNFEKQVKKLVKKYHSLKHELNELEHAIIKHHPFGTPIGKGAYKIRLAVRSKGKGKSGGLRVITYIEIDFYIKDLTNIFLLSIYDKSETQTISKEELKRMIESVSRFSK